MFNDTIYISKSKTDVPRIDGFAKLHKYSAILAWLFVLWVFLLRVY